MRAAAGSIVLLGVWVALVPTLMLFLSLISAYIVRQGLADDWLPVEVPRLLWGNTLVLVASSVTLEIARRGARRGRHGGVWLGGTALLGAGFLAGQWIAWQQMLASGVGLGTTPYGSFFYVLSGTHAAHVVLALAAVVAAALWPAAGRLGVSRPTTVRAAAVFWHFLGVLWLSLFSLLIFWR